LINKLGVIMRVFRTNLAIAITASILIIQPTVSLAAQKKAATSQAASWDGTWTGKWGGRSTGRVTVKGNKVVSYHFQGSPQMVGSTKISGKTLRFGDGYSVVMTMSGENSADATWRGNGTAKAKMSR
jgi:hypothetical protein